MTRNPRRWLVGLFLTSALAVSSCTTQPSVESAPVDAVPTTAPTEEGPSIDEIDWQISWNQIGPVQVGSTLEQIEAAVGPGFEIRDAGTLGEALGGYSVALDGEVLLYFGTYESDDPIFEVLFTDNPRLALERVLPRRDGRPG